MGKMNASMEKTKARSTSRNVTGGKDGHRQNIKGFIATKNLAKRYIAGLRP